MWCVILADERQEKNLKIVMLDINMMEILFKIFKLNVRTLSPDSFVFDPVTHAHKLVSYNCILLRGWEDLYHLF
jgi:hypothetical protein